MRNKLVVMTVAAVLAGGLFPHPASAESPTLVGAWLNDGADLGTMEIYRGYSSSFKASWSQTGYASKPGRVDYSFKMKPEYVTGNAAAIRRFVATTPKDVLISMNHEPEDDYSPLAFRESFKIFADQVHAQNTADGGRRKVNLILMGYTFRGGSGRNPMDWYPGSRYVDVVSTDVYSDPQGPDTHDGYTNGVNWRSASQLFDPTIEFAQQVGKPWGVSEFGYLEDASKPYRKASAITAAYAYAASRGAHHIEYWSGEGRRGDWALTHSAAAVRAARQAIAAH